MILATVWKPCDQVNPTVRWHGVGNTVVHHIVETKHGKRYVLCSLCRKQERI